MNYVNHTKNNVKVDVNFLPKLVSELASVRCDVIWRISMKSSTLNLIPLIQKVVNSLLLQKSRHALRGVLLEDQAEE